MSSISIGDTLGIIFAGTLILIAIIVSVWFFIYRKPSGVGASCTDDNDCINSSGKNPAEQYQGEVCVKGVCQNVACNSNSTCKSKLPGSTCFGIGPVKGKSGCVPMSCRSTNDCNPGLTSEQIIKNKKNISICVGEDGPICVPSQTSDGKKFKGISGLMSDGSVCKPDEGLCPGGTYCDNGMCLECGRDQTNLCSKNNSGDATAKAAPYQFCDMGVTGACANTDVEYKCTNNMIGPNNKSGPITLPDGSKLKNNVGICLPKSTSPGKPPCAFSWFNPTASADPKELGPGYCPSSDPYCTPGGCQKTPFGAVCGRIAGIPSDGKQPGRYDITGLCSGRLVPVNSYANLSQYNPSGNYQGSEGVGACSAGKDNPAKNPPCQCTPGKKGDCPKGTFCQKLGVTVGGNNIGLCTISSGTGSSSGSLGYFYANSDCVPNAFNIPVCQQLTDNSFLAGGPGDFCYVESQCLYSGKPQPNNPLRALTCLKNQCVGIGIG